MGDLRKQASERILEPSKQVLHWAEVACGCALVCSIELCAAKDVPASRGTKSILARARLMLLGRAERTDQTIPNGA